jgi:hypothetical protein
MIQLDWKNGNSSCFVALRRRGALAIIVGVICFLSNAPNVAAVDDDRYSSWFFTSEEVAAAYQYQQNYGERLRFPLRAGPCLFRSGEFATSYRRNPLAVSCRFVLEVTRHMKEMLDAGAAKFLFPLDADHAHLGVPMEVWNSKYKNLPVEQVFPAILREPGLVALYHTAEHLRVSDRKTGAVNAEAKAWQEKRNVLGYFDGRPIKILKPDPKGSGVAMPEDYYSYGGFSFLASPRGELYLTSGLNMITFDIAFDANAFDDAEEQHAYSTENTLLRADK